MLLEPGRSGVAAVERAVAIAREHEAALVLVALAPQADSLHCSAPAKGVNDAIFETVAGELAAATEQIGRTGSPASSALLVDGRDPALHRWVRERRVDLVLLPARRPTVGPAPPSGGAAAAAALGRTGPRDRPVI